jgi:hypothetical protein
MPNLRRALSLLPLRLGECQAEIGYLPHRMAALYIASTFSSGVPSPYGPWSGGMVNAFGPVALR